MNWKQLLNGVEYTLLQRGTEPELTDITYDSRKVKSGSLFAAVSGQTFDGHAYVEEAARKGAVLAVIEKDLPVYPEGMTVVKVASVLEAMPLIAVNFYDKPSESMTMIGVTGTKGKTTTTTLIHRIIEASGRKAGLVGTIENKIGETVYPSQYTTPQAFDLEALLAQMKDEGVNTVAMEVSSHSIALHRIDGMKFDIAVFTNLSLEHLDFHHTMEEYLQTKMELFRRTRLGLSNADSPEGRRVLAMNGCRMLSYGIDSEDASYRAVNLKMTVHGLSYDIATPEGRLIPIRYPYPGRFNVYNTLAAAVCCLLTGVSEETIRQELARTDAMVRGRFQTLHSPRGVAVIVDYAHVPDALENVLTTIQEFKTHRVITVVGCGGDRDRTKRPVMGRVAGRFSDHVVLTSDNPRTEDPLFILSEIEPGVKETGASYEVIPDRRQAIRRAIHMAEPGDVVLLAGKGHEDYQIIGHEKIHLDDVEEAEAAFREENV